MISEQGYCSNGIDFEKKFDISRSIQDSDFQKESSVRPKGID